MYYNLYNAYIWGYLTTYCNFSGHSFCLYYHNRGWLSSYLRILYNFDFVSNCNTSSHFTSNCWNIPTNNQNRSFTNPRTPQRDIREVVCYRCNQRGHYATTCRARTQPQPPSRPYHHNPHPPSPPVICQYCNMQGHVFKDCQKQMNDKQNQHNPNEHGSPVEIGRAHV